jgi:hypothetical protein
MKHLRTRSIDTLVKKSDIEKKKKIEEKINGITYLNIK